MTSKKIYGVDECISFRFCSLTEGPASTHGDCTSFSEVAVNFSSRCQCDNYGIHYHCSIHREIELNWGIDEETNIRYLSCPVCKNKIEVNNSSELRAKCLRMKNAEIFKDAEYIRLDDWYIPQIKQKLNIDSDYWMTNQVKTDKDGDTIVILYIGCKKSKEKIQFFIKPEKGQLSNDHKDLDPEKILSKIEVTLKNKKIIQEFNDF